MNRYVFFALVLSLAGTTAVLAGPPLGGMGGGMGGGMNHAGHMMAGPVTDERQPLYMLVPMALRQKAHMRGHLQDVNDVVAALAKNDFAAAAAAGKRLGNTPEMDQMRSRVAMANPAFEPIGRAFRLAGDAIAPAAEAKDKDATLVALAKTLDACVSCHTTYRHEVVDQAKWDELTAAATK